MSLSIQGGFAMRSALVVASILLMSAIAASATIYVPDNYATI